MYNCHCLSLKKFLKQWPSKNYLCLTLENNSKQWISKTYFFLTFVKDSKQWISKNLFLLNIIKDSKPKNGKYFKLPRRNFLPRRREDWGLIEVANRCVRVLLSSRRTKEKLHLTFKSYKATENLKNSSILTNTMK